MKIQILGIRDRKINIDGYDITYSDFAKPKTLDSFDINIIDLQDEFVWVNKGNTLQNINIDKDLQSIKVLLQESNKAYNIVTLPQNYTFRYNMSLDNYTQKRSLKDMITSFLYIYNNYLLPTAFNKVFNIKKSFGLIYENSFTKCSENDYNSAFSIKINDIKDFEILTKANDSNKPTTILYCEGIIVTALELFSKNKGLKDFLMEIGLDKQKTEEPSWVKGLNYFDDQQQNSLIQNNNKKIEELQQQNMQANEKLAQNSYYKSILYESGVNLVKVVFDILSKMLDYDLSNFEDKKEEDILIKLDDLTIVGEIKGIKGNVTSENVSQTIRHKSIREDNNEKEGLVENVKGILIVNAFRFKSLQEREKVQAKQINEAQKNDVLIILSQDLLKLFEDYLNKKVTKDKIVDAFKNQVGLFDITMV